jgi:glycerophosphoryl diester phosphodiesterase
MDVEYVRIWQTEEAPVVLEYKLLRNNSDPKRFMAATDDNLLTTVEGTGEPWTDNMLFAMVPTDAGGKYYLQTKDGRYVLLHDNVIDRVTDGKGACSDYTLEELRKFRLKSSDGKTLTDYGILTLEEAFDLTRGKILVNLDKFPRDPKGIAECVRRCGMEREVVLKGHFMPGDLKKRMGDQWQGIADGTFLYMPILNINSPKSVNGFEAWQKAERVPFGYELCFEKETPLDVLESLEAVQDKNGPRIWINTLWDSLCAGHTDARGFKGDPDGSWGWCLGRKATIIQTDRPKELIEYLAKKGRRNLD